METEKVFKNFHTKNQNEIVLLVKKFIEEDFLQAFPQLKNEVAILINGSVASGYYDAKSDIDLDIVFPDEKSWKEYKFKVLDHFKGKYLESKKKPIEVHGQNITFFKQIEKELELWKKDWMLREFSDAIVLYDTKNKIKKLKEKYNWYPENVYLEKMNWLFAEATFLLLDRYKVGMERSSFYYTETIKMKILRLLLASLVMANHQFPVSDKHLFNDLLKSKNNPKQIKKNFEKILKEKNPKKIFLQLSGLRKDIEEILIGKKLIKKNNEKYWIGFRTTYKVEIEK